mgnify:CR=1 FL=1
MKMNDFNLMLDDALTIIIIAVLLLMAAVVIFKDVEYNARLMHCINIEQAVQPDCYTTGE